jgi:hypothetical protein
MTAGVGVMYTSSQAGHTCLTTYATTHTNPEIVRLCLPRPQAPHQLETFHLTKAGDGSPVGVTASRLVDFDWGAVR